jgi:hypothetical protein
MISSEKHQYILKAGGRKMRRYEIVTREDTRIKGYVWGSKLTFLTKASNVKSALKNLINNSNDFRMIGNDNKKLKITIKVLK